MSELISGEEAKLAWANSHDAELSQKGTVMDWCSDFENYSCGVFNNNKYIFRLKPRTITINGVEVPAPFEPKDGDVVFVLDNANPDGFSSFVFDSDFFTINFGSWRTEEEIKQVVEALRSVFKTQ